MEKFFHTRNGWEGDRWNFCGITGNKHVSKFLFCLFDWRGRLPV